MRLGNITQSAHRGSAIVCISEEPYCVNSYMIQRRWEVLFRGHYCQQRQIEYTRYTYTNNISYKNKERLYRHCYLVSFYYWYRRSTEIRRTWSWIEHNNFYADDIILLARNINNTPNRKHNFLKSVTKRRSKQR